MKSHKKDSSSMEKDRTHLLLWFKQHGFTATETKQLCEHIRGIKAQREKLQTTIISNFCLIQIGYHTKLIQLLEGKVEADSIRGWDSRVPYLTGAQDLTIRKAKLLVRLEKELKKTKLGKNKK